MTRIIAAATLAAAGAAVAQPAITIEVDNPVLMPGESTVVTMYAGFDPSDYAMAYVETDFLTSVGSEGWSDARLVSPMDGSGTSAGVASGTGYDAIVAGQIYLFSVPDADTSNPIDFWQATYTAPVDASRPFVIDVSTMTSRYDVYFARDVYSYVSRLDDLTEGAATIRVIPAPASALLLAVGLLSMRRHRCSTRQGNEPCCVSQF